MAGKPFPSVALTPSGRPILKKNEIESSIISSVDLESDDLSLKSSFNFLELKSGILILTSHRLIWIHEATTSASRSSSEGVYIPLSSVTHIFEHKKSLKNMFATPRVRFQIRVKDGCVAEDFGGAATSSSSSVVITIVRRGKGDLDVFVGKFWEAWRGRAWENDVVKDESEVGGIKEGFGGGGSGLMMAGLSGILRKEQEMWESTDKSLQDAFQDLTALMVF